MLTCMNWVRLDTWNQFTAVSAVFVVVYPFGVPLLMLMLMRYNGVHRLARQKIAGELVTSLIGEYMKAKVTTSTQKVSFFIGLLPSMELHAGSDESAVELILDPEFERRTKEVFLEMIPEHRHCVDSCCGHQLPGHTLWLSLLCRCFARCGVDTATSCTSGSC